MTDKEKQRLECLNKAIARRDYIFSMIKQLKKEIFWKGKTEMGVVWLMLLLGLVFGFFLRRCVC